MKLFLTIFLLIPVTIYAADTMPEQFVGRWVAYSNATEAIYGDLEVTKDSLSLNRFGSYSFVLLGVFDDYVVPEMSKSYPDDCGQHVRLGPIEDGRLNFAVYESTDKALATKKLGPYSGRCEYPDDCECGLYSLPTSFSELLVQAGSLERIKTLLKKALT